MPYTRDAPPAIAHDVVQSLVGTIVTMTALEQFEIRIMFDNASVLQVECGWELIRDDGSIADSDAPLASRARFELWRACGQRVVSAYLATGDLPVLTLTFESEWRLRVLANDDQYEDWSLTSETPGAWIICMGADICNSGDPQVQ